MSHWNWRRAFRFNLRILFLVVSLSAVGIYVTVLPIRDYHVNKEIDQRLSRVGGRVQRASVGRGWFLYFYPKFASRIVRVDLVNMHVRENELNLLPQLTEMHSLYLFYTDVDDVTIAPISACSKLTTLDLDGTRVGDAGVKAIARLPRLQWLGLRHTRVSDAGLRHLHSANSLKTVVLWKTQVTEDGVRGLRSALPEVTALRMPFENSAGPAAE
jgi:hypothetical protein